MWFAMQKSTDMKAVKCGEAVVINMHGTLTQMDPPTGGDPETCDILKFTMSNLTSVHKVLYRTNRFLSDRSIDI